MQDAASRSAGTRFSERDRTSAKEELLALGREVERLSSGLGEAFVPVLSGARRMVAEADSPVRAGVQYGAATLVSLRADTARAGARLEFRMVAHGGQQREVQRVGIGGTLTPGTRYDTNTLDAIDVDAAADGAYTLYADPTAVRTLGGTIATGAVFAANAVTAVTTAAPVGTTFTLTRVSTHILRLRNNSTGSTENLNIVKEAATSGAKVLNFGSLGVSISLNGPAESSVGALGRALNNGTITVTNTDEYRTLRLVDQAGGSQTIDTQALASGGGAKVLDFAQLGVSLALSGSAESSPGALVMALHGKTLTRSTVTLTETIGAASMLELSDVDTGQQVSVGLGDGEAGGRSASLAFGPLGLELSFAASEQFTLRQLAEALSGQRIELAAEEDAPFDLTVAGAGDLSGQIVSALARVDERLHEVEAALGDLPLVPVTGWGFDDAQGAAVAAQNVLSRLDPRLVDMHLHVDGAIVARLLAH